MEKNNPKKNGKLDSFKKSAIFIISFSVLFFTLMSALIAPKYSLKEGDIAKVDIKAPVEVVDEAATAEKRKQAEDAVDSQFTKKNEVKNTAIENIRSLFLALEDMRGNVTDKQAKVSKLKSLTSIKLSDEYFGSLVDLKKEDAQTLKDYLIQYISEIYDSSRIGEDKPEDIKRAQEAIATRFNSSNLTDPLKVLGTNIGYTQIQPNLILDSERTEDAKKNAADKVEQVTIKKDQIIVKNGEPVTQEQINLLKQLNLLDEDSTVQWRLYTGLVILVLMVLLLQWSYLLRYYKSIYQSNKKLILISVLTCLSVVLTRTVGMVSPFLIPFACVPLLMAMLINYKISLAAGVLNIILISASVGFNLEATALAILNTVMGAVILRKMQARNDIFLATIFITIVNVMCTFSIGILLSSNTIEIIKRAGIASIGSIISAVLTVGLLPFFESTFDIVTVVKLLELGNPNQPLLKRLLLEAPGTYHHSILVANLAEVAAEEIGANSLLARVGAYYHDVGKIKRPYFFKENQMGAENPHNKITPNLSALIIISHVKDGLELAKVHRIPQCLLEFIEQHHGNSLVKYFYITMKNSSDHPEEVAEEDFRYSGPVPKAKETAIVMLADCVEAAVRSLSEPTVEKIETMVNNLFKDKLNDGQLNGSDLTFNELEIIKKTFLKTLSGIYHQRIEYPEEKNIGEVREINYDLH
ncbi:MAG: HD family phosphohydrolase [Bacillota bacterium]|nr:HD family phosphohydrolase [Bacillota bacterium]